MSRVNPWMKFYPADWQADERLRMCSLAARALWMEMIALMHRADPYGHLLVNGMKPSNEQLAVLAGASAEQVGPLVLELESAGVFSRTRNGTIFSRRMTSDEKKGRNARENGKNGGNPSLSNKSGNSASDKGQVKGGVNPQRPEARSQRLESTQTERTDDRGRARDPAVVLQVALDPLTARRWADHLKGKGRLSAETAEAHAATLLEVTRLGGNAAKAVQIAIAKGWKNIEIEWLRNAGMALERGVVAKPGDDDSDWRERVKVFADCGIWGAWGPRPGDTGCRVPSAILSEFGLSKESGDGQD